MSWLRYWSGVEWTPQTALTVAGTEEHATQTSPATDIVIAPAESPIADAPPESTTTFDWSGSGWVGLPGQNANPPRTWWRYSAAVIALGFLLIATLAFARNDHKTKTTTEASRKVAVPTSHGTPVPLTVAIASPDDGETVQARSVVVRGVVSRSGARVTVNGRSAAVRGSHFTIRVPLRLGYNGLDIAAQMSGAEAGTTTGSIFRVRTARERAALLARKEARQLAAEQPPAAASAEPSGRTQIAPRTTTTQYGGSPSTQAPSVDGADLQGTPETPSASPTTAPTTAPVSSGPAEPTPPTTDSP